MTEAPAVRPEALQPRTRPTLRSLMGALEVDTRLLGMVAALAVIWIGFNVISGGLFITPRNLWNLSVQSASIAVMATGMVLIIVSRNIDLSVGSLLGFLGYTMAMVQIQYIPVTLGLGYDQPLTWLIALAVGLVVGALIGALTGFVVAFGRVPAFIVTLGGFLIWRGLIFSYAQGQTLAPLDTTFQLLGGGPTGSLGATASWIVGLLTCLVIVYGLINARRQRNRYGFPLRPMWAEVLLGVLGCVAVLGTVYVFNSYYWPEALAREVFGDNCPGDCATIPVGIAYPVLIALGVGAVMTFIARRRKFGRYVFAIGGNPDAAELGGINVRRTVMFTFVVMGILCAISGAIQTARLNAAVTSLGVQNELDVISAAVIGGTSFAGGIGTIPGAILGAVVMQSLRSGMVLLRVDSPTQDIVVGIVLVAAVFMDSFIRRHGR